eukprot:TRINITY_DN35443_c0_g1_i1.p1 TRINITY_DN35443_c0_g1~~TRINITY_DN35443_c0_g1_i1.p1  ORF type:complete len:1086 (+),score=221.42 TRINITY_DN35443_c0_g1_i1:73-3330(+)
MPGPYHVSLQAATPGRLDGLQLPGTMFLDKQRTGVLRPQTAEPRTQATAPYGWSWDTGQNRNVLVRDSGETVCLLAAAGGLSWPGASGATSSQPRRTTFICARPRRAAVVAAAAAVDGDLASRKFCFRIGGPHAAFRSACVGVCTEPFLAAAAAASDAPLSEWSHDAPGWGLLWTPAGEVLRVGRGSQKGPIARTEAWKSCDIVSVTVGGAAHEISLTKNGASVWRSAGSRQGKLPHAPSALLPCAHLRAANTTVSILASDDDCPSAAPLLIPDGSQESEKRRVISVKSWRRRLDEVDRTRSSAGALSRLREIRTGAATPEPTSIARSLAPLSSVGRQGEWTVPPVWRGAASGVGLRPRTIVADEADVFGATTDDDDATAQTAERRSRQLYKLWMSGWQDEAGDYLSTAVWAEVVLRQLHHATRKLPQPHALRTAATCLVIERLVPLFGRLAGVMRTALGNIYHALFSNFADCQSPDEAENPLSALDGDAAERDRQRNTPHFMALKPWHDVAADSSARNEHPEPDSPLAAHAGLLQDMAVHAASRTDLTSDVNSMSLPQLQVHCRVLQDELRDSQRLLLRVHFHSWRQVLRRGLEQEHWSDVLRRAKVRVLLNKYFRVWCRKFAVRRAKAAEMLQVEPVMERSTVAPPGVDTTQGWAQLQQAMSPNDDLGPRSESKPDDALGGCEGEDEAVLGVQDLQALLLRWVEACMAVPGMKRSGTHSHHQAVRNFSYDFQDGSVMLSVVNLLAEGSIPSVGTPLDMLDHYFKSERAPATLVFRAAYHLPRLDDTITEAVMGTLFRLWLNLCRRTLVDDPASIDPYMTPFQTLSSLLGVDRRSRSWSLLNERLRQQAAALYLQRRRKRHLLATKMAPVMLLPRSSPEDLGRRVTKRELCVNVEVKEVLLMGPVREVLNDSGTVKTLGAFFKRAAGGDDEITLAELVTAMRELGWLPTEEQRAKFPLPSSQSANLSPTSEFASGAIAAGFVLAIEDVHAVFELCQGSSESGTDAAGGDGDATIDFSEFVDACGLLSAFWWPEQDQESFVDGARMPYTEAVIADVVEHIQWYLSTVLCPTVLQFLNPEPEQEQS